MKNDRYVYYKDVKPQDMGGGVIRRVLAYSDDLMVVENTFEKGAVGSLHQANSHIDFDIKKGASTAGRSAG